MIPTKLSRIVDGDTIQVNIRGQKETVRLMCIDTEESQIGGSKPFTNAGVRAKHFTRELLTYGGELSLAFELGENEADQLRFNRDNYGRLLAHIYINDVHLNDELIRLGFSPYFNKYGNSRLFDAQLRAAQADAQHRGMVIWNPDTNRGGAFRDYDKLLPWWERRAVAVDLARYSDVNGSRKIFICDNECTHITREVAGGQKVKNGYLLFLVDFQSGFSSRFSKGWVIKQRSKGFLLRFFFSADFVRDNPIPQLLVSEKDYGFVRGRLERYRSIPQIAVDEVAYTPFEL